jgi:hypothetical protein
VINRKEGAASPDVVDESTREAISTGTDLTCTAEELVQVLEGLVGERERPGTGDATRVPS